MLFGINITVCNAEVINNRTRRVELDLEFSYFGRSLSRSRSGKYFKKPDQEPEPELFYGSFGFELSFAC